MTVGVGGSSSFTSSSFTLSLRAYTITLILSASLYFLRFPGISVYIFDVIWLFGLALFPRLFLRMPRANYLSICALSTATFLSICYVEIDKRPLEPIQAIIILMRFLQMTICANFFYNCLIGGKIVPRDFLFPALISLLIPILGGLALYQISPEMAVTFNRYSGYFGNPNSLSLYVVVSASVFYALMRLELVPRWTSFTLKLIFFAVSSYSLMLTGSNSGMLLFIVVTMIAFLSSLRGVVFLFLGVGVLFLFILPLQNAILAWAFDMMNSDFSGLQRTGNLIVVLFEGLELDRLGSSAYRDEVKDYLFEQQFRDLGNVLVGLGVGQSKNMMYIIDSTSVTIHNFYLLIFLEFGLLGSVCFAVLSFLTFNRFHWDAVALLAFSGFLLASSGTPVLYLPFFWVPLFAVLAGVTHIHLTNRAHGL